MIANRVPFGKLMAFILAVPAAAACASLAPLQTPNRTIVGGTSDMPFTLTSTAFAEGGDIPQDNACDGSNSPIPLAWSGTPQGTTELALIMDDPDANGFVHWVVVGIPAAATGFADGSIPAGATEGQSGFGRAGYGGPCPPSGTHRYDFTLFALSSPLGLSRSATAAQVRSAAAGKTIAEAQLTGRYSRQR